jgi:deoxyribodipyrimidine photolyase-related protein
MSPVPCNLQALRQKNPVQRLSCKNTVSRVNFHITSCVPGYAGLNALEDGLPLPEFFCSGETGMHTLHETLQQTLRYGYAHHMQRLMITGLYCLLYGVRPQAVHEWYLAVYVNAVEWVELPRTPGMSQYADGVYIESRPCAASGAYLNRMSNYCAGSRYDPSVARGDSACPFNTLYCDFPVRHKGQFTSHPGTALQWRAPGSKDSDELKAIGVKGEGIRFGSSG